MRINEIILEDTDIDEARPMGMLQHGINALKSMTPTNMGQRARGSIETGKVANQLMAKFHQWMGRTNQPATKTNLLNFLKQSGLSDSAIKSAEEKIGGQTTTPTTPTQPVSSTEPVTPPPTPVKEDGENTQEPILNDKVISDAIMAAAYQQALSGQTPKPIGTPSGNAQQPTSGGARTSSNNTMASSDDTVDQVDTTADTTQQVQPDDAEPQSAQPAPVQPSAKQSTVQEPVGPKPEQEVTFPGTTPPLVFKYTPQWLDSNGNPAAPDVVAALDKLAIGQELSMPALKKARAAMGLPENKKIKKNSITEFHSNFLGKDI